MKSSKESKIIDENNFFLKKYGIFMLLILVISLVFFFAEKEKIEDITGKATWNTSTQQSFDLGTHTNTTSNSSGAIFLNQTVFLDDLNSSGYMIAWWHMDYNDSSYVTPDSSGRGNHLTITTSATSRIYSNSTTAKFNNSYYFNEGIDTYMTAAHSPSLNLTNNFTVAIWIYDVSSTTSVAIDKNAYYIDDVTVSGKWGFYIRNNSAVVATTDNEAHPFNTWQLLVGRKNDSHISCFVDGVEKASTSMPGLISNPASGGVQDNFQLRIGIRTASGSGIFQGNVDETMIFNRSLSNDEIADLYRRMRGTYQSPINDTNPATSSFEFFNFTLKGNSSLDNITFQVRSCNDALCDTETFQGPGGDANSWFNSSGCTGI